MKKTLRAFAFTLTAAIVAAALFLASCAAGAKPVAREPGETNRLVILHTNDHHGSVLPVNGEGGLAERASFVRAVRESEPNVLLIDSGDVNTGSALSNMFSAEVDIRAYNMIGYDAVALGNHEFDGTLKKLRAQMRLADFTFLSANVLVPGGKTLAAPYIVRDFPGMRVGIFGLTTRRTLSIASPDPSLSFADEIETARATVAELRGKRDCDLVIALTHLGLVKEEDGHVTSIELAERVPGIDLIVDGHSHTALAEPRYAAGVPIVSANEFGRFVGRAEFAVRDGKVASFSWSAERINSKEQRKWAPDPKVAALIEPYRAASDASLKEVVARATAGFEFGDRLSRKKEIALGDMVNDGALWYVQNVLKKDADFAFTNGGNIRAEIPSGEITRGRIATVLPFDNWLYIASMRGEDVLALFEYIASVPQGAGAWAQVSAEVRYTIEYPADGSKGILRDLTIGGKPIDPAATYRLVTNDYLMGGGDGYAVLARRISSYNTSVTLRDAIIAYARAAKELTPTTDGRIVVIGGMKFN